MCGIVVSAQNKSLLTVLAVRLKLRTNPARVANAEANGAVRHGGIIDSEHGTETERKFRDPNGQVFDLTGTEYARDFWRIAV